MAARKASAERLEKCKTASMRSFASADRATSGSPRRRDRPVDRDGADRNAVSAEQRLQISRAILPDEIEDRLAPIRETRHHEARERRHVAVGRLHLGEGRSVRHFLGARADREDGDTQKTRFPRMRHQRADRIRAGEDDRRPGPLADRRVDDRLDAQERGDERLPPAHAERSRGSLGLRLRAGDQEAHGSAEKSGTGALFEFAPGIEAERDGLACRTGAARLVRGAAVRLDDQPPQTQFAADDPRVRRDRGFA